MTSEMQTWRPSIAVGEVWPPDDTEERVVGIHWHQTTITDARLGINGAASLSAGPGAPAPWQALSQSLLLGLRRPDGTAYRTYPDVFVYPHPVDPLRGSMVVAADGPPALVIEVLSEATYRVDLDLEVGKGWSYQHAGVAEYLALDPVGEFVPEGIRAWRLRDGVYRPWEPDQHGRWGSERIGVAVALEGTRVAIYTTEGRRLFREGEAEQAVDQERRLRTEQASEIERLRRLLQERP